MAASQTEYWEIFRAGREQGRRDLRRRFAGRIVAMERDDGGFYNEAQVNLLFHDMLVAHDLLDLYMGSPEGATA